MIRVLVGRGGGAEQIGLLDGEAHHLKVRRARVGEVVELRDGEGLVGVGRLVQVGKDWQVQVTESSVSARPAPITLAVGAGDRDRFAWVVEKAAELEITSVVPLETERTAAVATRVRPQHLRRLRRHALESVKQSGAAWATQVEEPVSLRELASRPPVGLGWLADAAGVIAPVVLPASPLTIVVGPEGGLTADERALLLAVGYTAVSFGPNTLRFETAAVAAALAAVTGRLRGKHG
jgi:16S rRNA (uracil1498-N3)-methyltransferase